MIYWRAGNLEIDTNHFCHVHDQTWKPSIFILNNQIPGIGVGVDRRKMGGCGVLIIKIVKLKRSFGFESNYTLSLS